jgi:hypothetical protein
MSSRIIPKLGKVVQIWQSEKLGVMAQFFDGDSSYYTSHLANPQHTRERMFQLSQISEELKYQKNKNEERRN